MTFGDRNVLPVVKGCYQARVIQGGASDHYPVVGVFGRRNEARLSR